MQQQNMNNPYRITEVPPPPPKDNTIITDEIPIYEYRWKNGQCFYNIIGYTYNKNNLFKVSNDQIVINDNTQIILPVNNQKSEFILQADNSPKRAYFNPPLKCPVTGCYKKFESREELEKHICTHAQKPKPSVGLESDCPVSYIRRNNNKRRISQILTDSNEIITEKMVPYYMKRYIKKGINCLKKRIYICTLCVDKTFSRRGHAKVHIRAHCGAKPYICSWTKCNRKFGQGSHLNRHTKIHKNIRKHICTICKHSFVQKSNLNAHIRIHQPINKIWKCNYNKCTKQFTRRSGLQRHFNNAHNGI